MPSSLTLCGRWDISWVQSGEDFAGKKRIAFLSSPLYRFIQNQNFSVDISISVAGLEESLAFKYFVGDDLKEEYIFQLGNFSYKSFDNGSVQVTILQNSDDSFRKISVLRIGPQLNQRSCEHYFIDNDGNLRSYIMATDVRGEVQVVRRLFTRFPFVHPSVVRLRKFSKTLGWDSLKFWPGMVLELCQIKCIRTGRTKLPSLETETMWSIDQSVEAIRRTNFEPKDDEFRIDYWLQVTLGTKTWVTTASQQSLIALNDLVRFQNTVPSAVDSVFKKLLPQLNWKNYVELHRHVLSIDNSFRMFIQNFSDLAQNAIDAICCFLEIPQNIEEEQVKFIEMATELEGVQSDDSALLRPPSSSRLRSFTSFRIDETSESISRYPSATNVLGVKATAVSTSQSLHIQSVPSDDFAADSTVTAMGSADVFRDMSRLPQSLPQTPVNKGSTRSPHSFASGSNNNQPSVSSSISTKPASGSNNNQPSVSSSISTKPLPQKHPQQSPPRQHNESVTPPRSTAESFDSPRATSNDGDVDTTPRASVAKPTLQSRRAILDIAHRSSAHMHGGRGLRPTLAKLDSPVPINSHGKKPVVNQVSPVQSNEETISYTSSLSVTSNEPAALVLLDQSNSASGGERGDSFSSRIEEGEYSAKQLLGEKQEHLQYSDIYQDGKTALKYLPVDMVNAPKVKSSIARGLLADKLGEGMIVIKHGRQGKPKRKIIRCDPSVNVLLWYPESTTVRRDEILEGKGIKMSEIVDIRLGTEVDPSSIDSQLPPPPGSKNSGSVLGVKLFQKTSNAFSSFFTKGDNSSSHDSMYGTAVLRRNCTAGELALSFSLVLNDRTLDIQCLTKEDFLFLAVNLKEIVKPQLTPILRTASSHVGVEAYEENPLKKILKAPPAASGLSGSQPRKSSVASPPKLESKKSVRFVGSFDEKDDRGIVPERGVDAPHAIEDRVKTSPRLLAPVDVDAQFIESLRMSSTEALQIGLILTDQERKFGLNMYQSLTRSDKPKVEAYVARGFTMEEAILRIFEKKYVAPHLRTQVGPSHSDVDSIDGDEDEKESDSASKSSLGDKKKSSFLRNIFEDVNRDGISGGSLVDGTWEGLSSRLRSTDALQIGLLLSQQEANYNTNMYESLQRNDAAEIKSLIAEGKSIDDAVMGIFNRRYILPTMDCPTDSLPTADMATTTMANDYDYAHQQIGEGGVYTVHSQSGAVYQTEPNSSVESARNPLAPAISASLPTSSNTNTISTLSISSTEADVTRSLLEEQRAAVLEAPPVTRTGSSFFPNTASVLPASNLPGTVPPPRSIPRMNSSEAVQMAMMLSEQEEKYGVNMFDSLRPIDEPEIERLISVGYTLEQAVFALFEQKYFPEGGDNVFSVVDNTGPGLDVDQPPSPLTAGLRGEDAAAEEDDKEDENDNASQSYSVGQGSVYSANGSPATATVPYAAAQTTAPGYGYSPQYYGAYPGYSTQLPPQQQQLYQQQYSQQQMYMQQAYYQGQMGYNYANAAGSQGYYPGQQPQAAAFYGQQTAQQQYASPQTSAARGSAPTSNTLVKVGTSAAPSATNERPKLVTKKSSTIGGSVTGNSNKKEKALRYKDSDVKAIVNMGFTRDQAIKALSRNENNLHRAVDSLTR